MPKTHMLVTWHGSQEEMATEETAWAAFNSWMAEMNAEGWYEIDPTSGWELESRDRDRAMEKFAVILEKIVD